MLSHTFPGLTGFPVGNIVIRFCRELNALQAEVPSLIPLWSRVP